MAETYFITGAQGCIGSWIVKALAERGDAAIVFDRSTDARRLSAIMSPDALEHVRFIVGDITDAEAVRAALADSNARRVIHLAGLQVPTCKTDRWMGRLVNAVGPRSACAAAPPVGAGAVVAAGSAA